MQLHVVGYDKLTGSLLPLSANSYKAKQKFKMDLPGAIQECERMVE